MYKYVFNKWWLNKIYTNIATTNNNNHIKLFILDSDLLGRKQQENVARYATYLGLCIATCIIFQRNIYIASVIGLLVGIYISVSEYMIAHSNVQDTTANVDILGPA